MSISYRKAFLVVIICLPYVISNAQAPILRFKTISSTKNLTNSVLVFLKDARGMMWFGTSNYGLLRFDGKKLVSFQAASLIDAKYITQICEDQDSTLWISTEKGIYHFNPMNFKREKYSYNDRNPYSLASNNHPYCFLDLSGNLWATYDGILQKFDRKRKAFVTQTLKSNLTPAQFKKEFKLGRSLVDTQGRIWLYSIHGLFLFDPKNKFTKFYPCTMARSVQCMVQENEDDFFVSFWEKGLYKFNARTGDFKLFAFKDQTVRDLIIIKNMQGVKYLLSIHDKINFIDVKTGKIQGSSNDKKFLWNIQGNYFHRMYIDKTNTVWLASDLSVQYANNINKFSIIPIQVKSKDFDDLFTARPSFLFQDSTYNYIGLWYSRGALMYDKTGKFFKYINQIPPKANFKSRHCINNMYKSKNGDLWYSSEDRIIIEQKGKYQYVFLPKEMATEEIPGFRNILPRKDGLWWIRTTKVGILLFDPLKRRFLKQYKIDNVGVYQYLGYDKQHQLWMGSDNGVYCYDAEIDDFIRKGVSKKIRPIEYYDQNNIVWNIYFDKNNNKWVSTEKGLFYQKNNSKEFNEVLDPKGSSFNTVYKCLIDGQGVIWMNQENGLVRYDQKKKVVSFFDSNHGLPEGYEGFGGLFNWVDSSTILLGAKGKLISFRPRDFTSSGAEKLFITAISADEKHVLYYGNKNKFYVDIPAQTKAFHIHFAYPFFNTEGKYQLFYQLKNDSDQNWKEALTGDVSFYGLKSGNYLLQLKAENQLSSTVQAISLEIRILPLWYETLWARLLFFSFIGALLFVLVKWRINYVRQTQVQKRRITETEIAALKAQMNPHFMFNCLNSIDAFIYTNDKANATKYLNKFAKLMRNILESSKNNVVPLSKDLETMKLYVSLEELRTSFKFKTQFYIDPNIDIDNFFVPPLLLQPFIENAIIHGFRKTRDSDSLLIIQMIDEKDGVRVTISDNGIGIQNNKLLEARRHTSYGIKLSSDRLNLFNGMDTIISIRNKSNDFNFPGTMIEFKLNRT